MKKTIDINLGGAPFIIDEDAFATLKNYLDDIESRLTGNDAEIISDIESRLAEIFQSHLSFRSHVVDAEIVRNAINVMGQPQEFGEKKHINQMRENMRQEKTPKRLYRNLADRRMGGVCSGLAAYFGTDTTLIRVLVLLLTLTGGVGFMAYLILWIVIPGAYLNLDGSVNHF